MASTVAHAAGQRQARMAPSDRRREDVRSPPSAHLIFDMPIGGAGRLPVGREVAGVRHATRLEYLFGHVVTKRHPCHMFDDQGQDDKAGVVVVEAGSGSKVS